MVERRVKDSGHVKLKEERDVVKSVRQNGNLK